MEAAGDPRCARAAGLLILAPSGDHDVAAPLRGAPSGDHWVVYAPSGDHDVAAPLRAGNHKVENAIFRLWKYN